MAVQFPNMHRVDIEKGPVIVKIGRIFFGDKLANRIGAYLYNKGMPVLPGGSCIGTAVLCNRLTVPLTGVVSGNEVYIDLPAEVYSAPGPVQIYVVWTNGNIATTVISAFGDLARTSTDRVVDPGAIIPSVTAMMEAVAAAVASIPANYSALLAVIAPTYSEHETYIAGQYVWHSGVLYHALQNILVPEAWTAAHWEESPIAPELYEVRSDLSGVHDLVAVDSTNLYNPEHTAAGYKIDSDGTIVSDPSYNVTEAFTVPAGKKIYLSALSVSGGNFVGYRRGPNACRSNTVYNLNGEMIDRNTAQNSAYTYTNSTENPVLIRFQLWGTGAPYEYTDYYVAIVDAGATINFNTYEPYGLKLKPTILTANQQTLTAAQKAQARENIGAPGVDATLSVSGQAADAKTAGDAINALRTRLDGLGVTNEGSIIGWEQGRISGEKGGLSPDTQASHYKHCRITEYLTFPGSATTLTVKAGYRLNLRGYDTTKVKGFDQSLNASTTDTLAIPDPNKYYRLDIERTDGEDLSPDDLPDDAVTFYTMWQTDDTLTQPGKIADAGAVGAAIDDIHQLISDINGITPVPVVTGYYTIRTDAGNVFVDGQLKIYKSTAGWSYAFVECQEGDVFTIKGTGGAKQRLWSYVDAEGNVISGSVAPKKESLDMEPIPRAPENAAYLVCNANGRGLFVGRGELKSRGGSGDGTNVREFFEAEVTDTVNKILAHSGAPSLSLNIITDTHTNTQKAQNQRWAKDTLANVRAVNKGVYVDGIAHLGDLCQTKDVGATQEGCQRIMNEIQRGLCAANEKVYMVPGNHDGFEGHGPSTPEQNYAWMSKFNERYVTREGNNPYFYVDIEKPKLRLIFLATSVYVPNPNPTPEYPYYMINGVRDDQLVWLGQTALDVDDGRDVIFFSHISPHMDSFTRNRISIRGLCDAFNAHSEYDVYHYGEVGDIDAQGSKLYTANFTSLQSSKVVVWQCGHAHYDRIMQCSESGVTFPIVFTLCSLYQNLGSGTLPDAYTTKAQRTDETVTQDAWDTMIYRPDEEIIYYIRFGAGADRILHYNTISISEAYTLTPSITPATWTSTNEDQATVSDGVVTPVSAGTATIYAEAEDGTREYWFITVTE